MTTLITRCPHCEHYFKIDDKLINETQTSVRCQHCQQIFNANQSLFSFQAADGVQLSELEHRYAVQKKALQQMQALSAQMSGFEPVSQPSELNRVNTAPDRTLNTNSLAATVPSAPVKQEIIAAPLAQSEELSNNEEQADIEEEITENIPERKTSRRWIWGLLFITFLAVTIKMLAVYRSEVLEKAPQLQPVYEQLCQHLSCSNHAQEQALLAQKLAPVKLSAFKTEDAHLEKMSNNRWGISLYLINTSESDQPYPRLMIKLYDANRAVLLRHTLNADQYLFNPAEKMKAKDAEKIAFSFDLSKGEPASFSVQVIE